MITDAKLQQFWEISLCFRQFNVFFDHFVAFWHKILCQGWIKATKSPN